MRTVIPPLPNAPSWRDAQLKHRNNFTLYCCDLVSLLLSQLGLHAAMAEFNKFRNK